MRAEDGRGHPTVLTQLLLEVSGKDTPLSLLRDLSAGRLDDSFFASLAPLLFQAHQEFHDPVAAVIITEMGEDISLWATGLLDRFQLVHEPIPIILSGGIFKTEDPLLVDTILQKVHERVPRAEIRKACFEPVIGALLYAYELDAVPVTVELLSEIERSYAEITHTPCRN
jgi:hypothetical protein